MLDLNFIPSVGEIGNATHDIFYPNGATYAPWFKPRGKRMCRIFMLGGGSGGGGGFVGAASAAGGGGGGGSGAQTSLTLPLWALPDVMLVTVGNGGVGGASGAAGSVGTLSQISSTIPTNILFLANTSPAGGIAGAATGSATAGTAGAVSTIASAPVSMLHGLMTANVNLAGQAGGTGGLATGGAPIQVNYPTTGLIVTGGGGGGCIGTVGNGTPGALIAASTVLNTPDVAGGIQGTSTLLATDGNAGYRWPYLNNGMMVNCGGSGGGGSAFNTPTRGGNGGDGGYGCGGGGGGACLTGGVGGRGGNGGPGLVIITCW